MFGSGHNYYLYRHPADERFHFLPWDVNECFGAFALLNGRNLSVPELRALSPWAGADAPERPLVRRLLGAPDFRQRYLAHLRTVLEEDFTPQAVRAEAERIQDLIREAVAADPERLFPFSDFERNVEEDVTDASFGRVAPGLLSFLGARRAFLLAHPEVAREAPRILRAEASPAGRLPGEAVPVAVEVSPPGASAILHFIPAWGAAAIAAPLHDDGLHGDGGAEDGLLAGEVPGDFTGPLVRWYVEVRDAAGSVSFAPAGAEMETYSFRVELPPAPSTPVVLNEILASNGSGAQDPQGEREDWIEVLNVSGVEANLSGMHLSDDGDSPRKWTFPPGTILPPGGRLLVWADEDGEDSPGLHASFRLSADGESVLLVDADARGNGLLDRVDFPAQSTDRSWGRLPDGTGDLGILDPTPGGANRGSGATFLRGDAEGSGTVDLSDAVTILAGLFLGGPPPACADAADANDDGRADLSDAVALLSWLFLGGTPPPEPFPAPGPDLTPDGVECG